MIFYHAKSKKKPTKRVFVNPIYKLILIYSLFKNKNLYLFKYICKAGSKLKRLVKHFFTYIHKITSFQSLNVHTHTLYL